MRSKRSFSDRLETIAAVAAVLVFAMSACNTSGCLENQNSLPLAGFYSSADGEAISVDSVAIGGVGAPGDSLLTTSSSRVSMVYLPFRAADNATSFYFLYRQRELAAYGVTDTVRFTYDSEPRFVSEECGAMYFYRITGVSHTSNLIDSVGVADSLITNRDIEQIHIYFRTAEPSEP
ncbi:MAG: DUF6452 family protein [Clostridium sp.]|nr:DUF6452 family protein [Clostridium sp.]